MPARPDSEAVFLSNPWVPLDNNLVERQRRFGCPVVKARKCLSALYRAVLTRVT